MELNCFFRPSNLSEQGGNKTGGGLFVLDVLSGDAQKLLDNFHGLQFNSPNDVVVSRDGIVYFTDPSYGLQQKFRTEMQLGDYVWRFNPRTGDTAIIDEKFLQACTVTSTIFIFYALMRKADKIAALPGQHCALLQGADVSLRTGNWVICSSWPD